MRRIWPIAAILIGARLLLGNFILTTAKNVSFFDPVFTPLGLVLIVGGAYFLLRDYERTD
jgi:ABC-type enterobactin transport system permease subunit